MINNISSIKNSQCCGCGLCVDICKKKAIYMKDHTGFFYPKIDKEKCISCGMCLDNCIGNNMIKRKMPLLELYGGNSKNDFLLETVASGGIATEIATTFIKDGGIVYGVAYAGDSNSASFIRVTDLEELDKLKGSKYIRASHDGLYLSISRDIKNSLNVLFFGLPCECAAVHRIIGDSKFLLLCDLICHGPTSLKSFMEYNKRLERQFNSSIIRINMRDKTAGWRTPCYSVTFENGKSYIKPFYSTPIGISMVYLARDSCYNCKYKFNNSVADITIGDFWGIDNTEKNGVSSIVIHSNKGKRILENSNIDFFKINFEEIKKSNADLINSRKEHKNRKKFLFYLKISNVFIATYLCLPIRQKLKIIINSLFLWSKNE